MGEVKKSPPLAFALQNHIRHQSPQVKETIRKFDFILLITPLKNLESIYVNISFTLILS